MTCIPTPADQIHDLAKQEASILAQITNLNAVTERAITECAALQDQFDDIQGQRHALQDIEFEQADGRIAQGPKAGIKPWSGETINSREAA